MKDNFRCNFRIESFGLPLIPEDVTKNGQKTPYCLQVSREKFEPRPRLESRNSSLALYHLSLPSSIDVQMIKR